MNFTIRWALVVATLLAILAYTDRGVDAAPTHWKAGDGLEHYG